jgi:hypothetical protein
MIRTLYFMRDAIPDLASVRHGPITALRVVLTLGPIERFYFSA